MAPTLPTPPATLADFKTFFVRDFVCGDGPDTVMDADLNRAMTQAMTVYNPALFSKADGWVAFLNLTAHYVRINIQAVGGLQAKPEGLGIENQAEQLRTGAGAAGFSQSYVQPPARVLSNPIFMGLWVTTYGQNYVNMALLRLVGVMGTADNAGDGCPVGATPAVPFAENGP